MPYTRAWESAPRSAPKGEAHQWARTEKHVLGYCGARIKERVSPKRAHLISRSPRTTPVHMHLPSACRGACLLVPRSAYQGMHTSQTSASNIQECTHIPSMCVAPRRTQPRSATSSRAEKHALKCCGAHIKEHAPSRSAHPMTRSACTSSAKAYLAGAYNLEVQLGVCTEEYANRRHGACIEERLPFRRAHPISRSAHTSLGSVHLPRVQPRSVLRSVQLKNTHWEVHALRRNTRTPRVHRMHT